MRRFLRILETALILTGIGAAFYCGYAWWDSQRTQDEALKELSEMPSEPPATVHKRLPEGSPVGEVIVPRLGVAVAILEGTRPETLRRAIGHVQMRQFFRGERRGGIDRCATLRNDAVLH